MTRKSEITSVGGRKITISLNNARIPTNFFQPLVIQQTSTLLNYGLQTKTIGLKEKLGHDFDTILAKAGENSLIHGVTYLFWNHTNLVNFPAYTENGGMFMLVDEKTGQDILGIRFWQISSGKPTYVEVYDAEGQEELMIKDDVVYMLRAKRPYVVKRRIATGEEGSIPYPRIPIVTLRANDKGLSALSLGLKALIDQHDIIASDHSDLMARIKGIIWIFNNFTGTPEDVAQIKEEIEVLGIVASKDGDSTASPHSVNIPYAAVEYSLKILRHLIYASFMGYDTDTITGGSLTTVAIKATLENLNKKVGRWERQHVIKAVQQLLLILGVETSDIKFRYDLLTNTSESDALILNAFSTGVLDVETALNKLSFVDPDEVEGILERLALTEMGVPTFLDNSDSQNTENTKDPNYDLEKAQNV